MPAEAIATLVANRYFLARVWASPDADELLDVDDETFDAFDELRSEHGREESDDDDDLVWQYVSVPLYLHDNFVWDIELYDNGEDAGVTHRLRSRDSHVDVATIDAHPRGTRLTWTELELISRALDHDDRNAHLSAIAPVLLWSATNLTEGDDRAAVRARLADAWRRAGVDDDVADELAARGAQKRTSEPRDPHTKESAAVKQLIAALAPRDA